MTNKKIYLIGTGVILLALLIVLLTVLLPITVHKNKMEALLEAAASPVRLSVGDPLFETGDLFGNKGKEVLIEGERLRELTTVLKDLAVRGYRTKGTEKMKGGTMELNLKAQAASGEICILYFNKMYFYYMDGEKAVFFEAKDTAFYQEFYQKLVSCLTE